MVRSSLGGAVAEELTDGQRVSDPLGKVGVEDDVLKISNQEDLEIHHMVCRTPILFLAEHRPQRSAQNKPSAYHTIQTSIEIRARRTVKLLRAVKQTHVRSLRADHRNQEPRII